MPPKAIGKIENTRGEGSRGVTLFPGDMIQFGVSTRIYVLEGPREYERGAMKAAAAMNKNKATNGMTDATLLQRQRIKQDEQSKPALSTIPDSNQNPQKHQKLREKIQAKKYKLSNIQTEK